MHPEKVLEYWINRDREEVESFEAEKIWNQDTEEFQKAVEYLKTNSYEADEKHFDQYIPDHSRRFERLEIPLPATREDFP